MRRGFHGGFSRKGTDGEARDASHLYGTHQGSSETVKSGIPQWVEIEQAVEGGYLLVTIDGRGWSFVETWHATVEEAKAEAELDFSICKEDWVSGNRQEE